MSQTERILYIDRKLRGTGFVTIQDVVDEYEISSRQAKRDIEYMRDRFEAPIEWNYAKRAYIYAEPFSRLEFADQHIVLAYLSMQSMLRNANYFPAVSEQLLESFTEKIPKEYMEVCDKILYQVPFSDSLEPEFFARICSALRNKSCILIEYINAKNQETERIAEPYNLINYAGNWYVVCYDYLRNDFRTFNVSRIRKISVLKESFKAHGVDFGQKLKEHLESGFGIFFGKDVVTVQVIFKGQAANIIRTQTWHPKQKFTQIDSDKAELSFPAANLTEVLAKILSFGSAAIPIQPKELVDLWKNEIKKISELIKE